ncbi:hypothetical protein DI43_17830 [Geobacillus sp. CAMR12739]|nr:hypothetical protein DI43_17830 [Geobacillus sp. CAMR12739]
MEQWGHKIDLEKLIRSGLHPSQLNDDALARHLDRLYEAGIYRIFQRRVRQFITLEHPLKGSGGRKLTRPTGQAVFCLSM